MSPRVRIACICCLLALPVLAAAAPTAYTVTPVAGKFTAAVDLNNAGQVAVNNLGTDVPFRMGSISDGTTSESIGTLGGAESFIHGLNNRGEAVGQSSTAAGVNHAFVYAGGRMRDLTVDHGLDSAVALNDSGDIAGQVGERAAVLRADGTLDVFGPPSSRSAAINGAGDVAGYHAAPGAGDHAFLYAGGVFGDLGTPGGSYSVAASLNDAGAVVGYGFTAWAQQHAFLHDGAGLIDLAPSSAFSAAADINNRASIVGTMDGRAFRYADGALIDLNTLLGPDAQFLLTAAVAINDQEQILARACDPTGTFCVSAVRLDPIPAIPEPRGALLLLAGAALLAARAAGARRGRS
ncbi:MAG: hypothetical protein V4693_21375 [Pseudomonadota bacterium]